MDILSGEYAYAPRRSSRISAQARLEAPPKRTRKGPSNGANGAAKSTRAAGSARKRSLKEDQEGDQDAAEGERDQDAKKAKLPSAEETQAAADRDVAAEEPSGAAAVEPSSASGTPNNIDVGEILPSLILKNEKGEDVQTASLTTEKGVVLFLVPKADTPGCTTQACGFRDVWQEFGALNYGVYCLSGDSPAAQTKWQTKKQLPYQLLSDPQRTLIGALGAADGHKTRRSHFVFEKGGKLLDKKIPVKPADSPRLALEFIKGLAN